MERAVSHITCSVMFILITHHEYSNDVLGDANVKLLPVSYDQPHANLSALTEEQENQFKIQCLTQEE